MKSAHEQADGLMAEYWDSRYGALASQGSGGSLVPQYGDMCNLCNHGLSVEHPDTEIVVCRACGTVWPVSYVPVANNEVQDVKAPKLTAEAKVHRSVEVALQFARLERKVPAGQIRVYIAACFGFTPEDIAKCPDLFPGVNVVSTLDIEVTIQAVRAMWADGLAEIGRVRYTG